MNGTLLFMAVAAPMLIPLTFALTPVVCAVLLHLQEREDGLGQ